MKDTLFKSSAFAALFKLLAIGQFYVALAKLRNCGNEKSNQVPTATLEEDAMDPTIVAPTEI